MTYFLSKRILYYYVSEADIESVDAPVFGRVWGRSGMLSRYGISCYIGFFIPRILFGVSGRGRLFYLEVEHSFLRCGLSCLWFFSCVSCIKSDIL